MVKELSYSEMDKIIYQKASNYCFVIQKVTEGSPKFIGVYTGSRQRKKGYRPLTKGFTEFFDEWVNKKLTILEAAHLAQNYKLQGIFDKFFRHNPTVVFHEPDVEDEAASGREYKNSVDDALMAKIYEYLKKESYLYLHSLNSEGTIYEVLLLVNKETSTFTTLGQSTLKDLNSFIVNALDHTIDEKIHAWFAGLRDITYGAFRSKLHLVEIILSMLGPMKEYRLAPLKTIANHVDSPNYNYLDLDYYKALPDMPTPAWDDFIDLFRSEEKANLFKAFIWSIFNEANEGRQWLWLQGAGNDGKSAVITTIQSYMDMKFGASKMQYSAAPDSHKSQFFYGSVYNKRLLVFGDNRERNLFKVEAYLRISGGDHAPVEQKFVSAFTGRLYSKIIVASNFDPFINFSLPAETSRALVLRLDPEACRTSKQTRKGEANFKARLLDEFESFLKQCHEAYLKCIKPGSHDFLIPEPIIDEMKAHCATDEYNVIQYFLSCCLEYGAGKRVRAATLHDKFKEFCGEGTRGREMYFFLGVLSNELTLNKNCEFKYIASPSGIKTQYVLGCKLKEMLPKSYAAILRDEDAKDLFTSEDEELIL